jgi:translation elongation factor EF-Tu-like GTPase
MAVLADEPTPGLDEFKAKLQKVTDWYSANKDILKMTAKERLEMDERGQMLINDPYGAHKVMKKVQDGEMVNHPDHYQGKKMEVIDVIEDYDLGFSLGNAIKYILRADAKGNRKQDLKKAIWYIQREIDSEDL